MRATAVIGANLGDEGKGRTVDAISDPSTLVVRFNGGSQAGHTVEVQSTRHVFSHFGSGTLAGAATALSRFFVCEPISFVNEWEELRQKGISPSAIVDPLAPITTPYEVAINRALERSRGAGRHGSVGVGFGETIEREEWGVTFQKHGWEGARDFALTRVKELGLPPEIVYEADKARPTWLAAWSFMCKHITVADVAEKLRTASSVVFEGAQGLLLDQDSCCFPHVTRSKTGVTNVRILAKEAGIDELKVIYVTRSYLTRHGAGYLPGEDPNFSFPDKTNVHREFQGSLRFAPLLLDALRHRIKEDASLAPEAEVALSVTCLDQFGGMRLVSDIEDQVGIPVEYKGFGPKRGKLLPKIKVDPCFLQTSNVCIPYETV